MIDEPREPDAKPPEAKAPTGALSPAAGASATTAKRCRISLRHRAVKLGNYEGPLDLLLDLIRKQQINIYDIPIAKITQQYLDYLHLWGN